MMFPTADPRSGFFGLALALEGKRCARWPESEKKSRTERVERFKGPAQPHGDLVCGAAAKQSSLANYVARHSQHVARMQEPTRSSETEPCWVALVMY